VIGAHNRVAVLHGVNFDQLERRSSEHYGSLSFDQLQFRIGDYGRELGLELQFFQTNHEGAFVEELHKLEGRADGIILNPGAWTHYSWAIHDALELAALPAVEVHLSDVQARDEWRRVSVVGDLCLETVSGQGVEGYRAALARLKQELAR
jgi:3-dehydroquinate dehydratase II